MLSIRPAVENEIEEICSFDLIAQRENERREFIRRVVTSGECFVAVADEKVIGYAVLNYSFYHSGFIEMVYIRSDCRRSGAGCGVGAAYRDALPNSEVVHFHKPCKFADAIIACKTRLRLERSDSQPRRRRPRNCLFQAASLKKAEWLTIHRTCGQRNLSQPEARFITGICLMGRKSIIRNFSQLVF